MITKFNYDFIKNRFQNDERKNFIQWLCVHLQCALLDDEFEYAKQIAEDVKRAEWEDFNERMAKE